MAEIINLRRPRKQKRRADKEREAAANRLAHGRPKAERIGTALTRAQDEKRLDSHRRSPPGDDEG